MIFTNSKYVSDSGTLNINISDHLPIYVIKKKDRERTESNFVLGRSYRDLKEDSYIEDMKKIDVEDLFSDSDPNIVWDKMKSHFLEVANKHCPLRRLKVTINRPSFVTDELLELIRDRDYAFKEARRVQDDVSWSHAKILKARVQKEIYKARKEFIYQ